ncbi:hypothetical protein N473_22130 [Pseudoalteromonas luteoviolacea CPMOR-1]|uniref:Fibronectin type-III domain-containing protein n=1 Tax=Pseudoalteromonas luteoviolacea CPMOR-1 TaxID=1365248 RepID=A0A162AMA0_9GAMM|nr:tlde1 domain-containing protein [Pseudoalteromonas luteoviolacea]KZN61808.1 hypothetical protein N473_22130 [Pseudoalteromonas luteoviolacea CPMOR-1]
MSKFNTLCLYLLMCIGFTVQASSASKQQYCFGGVKTVGLDSGTTSKRVTVELADSRMASRFTDVMMIANGTVTTITAPNSHIYQTTRDFGVGSYRFISTHKWDHGSNLEPVVCSRTLVVKPYSKPSVAFGHTRDANDDTKVTLTARATDTTNQIESFSLCQSNAVGACLNGGYRRALNPNLSSEQVENITVGYDNTVYYTVKATNDIHVSESTTIAVRQAREADTPSQVTLKVYDAEGKELANNSVVAVGTDIHAVVKINDSDAQSYNWPSSVIINDKTAKAGTLTLAGISERLPCFESSNKKQTSCYESFSVNDNTTFIAHSGSGTSNAINLKTASLPSITDITLSNEFVTSNETVTLTFKAWDAGARVAKEKLQVCVVPGSQSDITSCPSNQDKSGGLVYENGKYSLSFKAPSSNVTAQHTVVILAKDNAINEWVPSSVGLTVFVPVGILLDDPPTSGTIHNRNTTYTYHVKLGALSSAHQGAKIHAIELYKSAEQDIEVAKVVNPGSLPEKGATSVFPIKWRPGYTLSDKQTFKVRARIEVNNTEVRYESVGDYHFTIESVAPTTPRLRITPSADAPGHFTLLMPPVNFADEYLIFERANNKTGINLNDPEQWTQLQGVRFSSDGRKIEKEIRKSSDTFNHTFTYCAVAYNGNLSSSTNYLLIKHVCVAYTNNNEGGLPLPPSFTNSTKVPSGPYTLTWGAEDQNSSSVRFKLESQVASGPWRTLLSNTRNRSFQIQNPEIQHEVKYRISSCNVNNANKCTRGQTLTLQHAPPVISFAKICTTGDCLEIHGTGFHQQGQIFIQENLTAIPHKIATSNVTLSTSANDVQVLRIRNLPTDVKDAYHQGGISVGVKNKFINSPIVEYSTGENIGDVIDPLNHTPTLGKSGQIYAGMGNQLCAFVEQTRRWCNTTGGLLSSRAVVTTASIGTDVIFAGSRDHSIYAWNQNGTQLWKNTTQGAIEAEGLLVGSKQTDATLFYGSNDGALYALNALDGRTKYVYKLGARTIQKPMMVGDNEIWVTTSGDQLHVIKRGSAGLDKLNWGDLQRSPLLDGFKKDFPTGWVPQDADHEATYTLLKLGYTVLERELSRSELSFLTYAVRYHNVTLREVADAMLQSTEGKRNHPESLTNANFYDSISHAIFFAVRQEVLGFSRSHWINELNGGLSRAEFIIKLMNESIEVSERYKPVVRSSLFYYYGICHDQNQCELTTDSDGDGVSDWMESALGSNKMDPTDGLLTTPSLTLNQAEAGKLSVFLEYGKNVDYFELHNPADNTGPMVVPASNKTATTSLVYPNGSHTFFAKACIEKEITLDGQTRIHRACSRPSATQVIEISSSTIQGQIHPLSAPSRAANYQGPSAEQLAQHHSLATTAGNFRVNEQGAATYSIPLPLPKGIAGVTPEVALTYNSQSGYSSVAFGWQLSAGSSITRCRQTKIHDGKFEAIKPWLDGHDRYCLDGSRLILTNNVLEGEVGAQYRSEIDSQIKVVVEAPELSGTKQFAVYGKDGSKRIYGGSPESELGGTSSYGWLLRQSMDRIAALGEGNAHNIVHYHYSKGSKDLSVLGKLETVLSKIEYSGNIDGTDKFSVQFRYQKGEARQLAYDYSPTHEEMVSQAELANISIYKGNEILSHIDLNFEYATNNVRLLKSVRECASNRLEVCKKPVVFDYTQSLAEPDLFVPVTLVSAPTGKKVVATSFVDLLGNGKPSLVSLNQTSDPRQHQLCIFESHSVSRCSLIDTNNTDDNIEMLALDKEDDGRQGLLIRTANSRSDAANKWEYFTYDGRQWHRASIVGSPSMHQLRLGDLNGDGFSDLLYTGGQGYNTFKQTWSQSVKDFSSFPEAVSLNYINDDKPFYLLDVNFDGLADVMTSKCSVSGCSTQDKEDVVFVHFNQYDSGTDKHKFGDSKALYIVHSRLMPMDINGDGIVDLGYVNANKQWAFSLLKPYSGSAIAKSREIVLEAPSGININPEDTHIAPIQADLDRDGIAELYVTGFDQTSQSYHLYRYDWEPASATFKLRDPRPAYDLGTQLSATDSIFFLDYDHDGVDELIMNVGDQLKVKEAIYSADPAAKLRQITQGYGNQTQIKYGLTSDPEIYTLGNHSKTELLAAQTNTRVDDLYGSAYLVKRVTTGSQQTINDVTSHVDLAVDYHYEGARIQFGGRGSLGFEALTTTTQKDGMTFKTRTEYSQIFPFVGMPTRTVKTMYVNNTNLVISDAKNDYQYHVNGCDNSTGTCVYKDDMVPDYFAVYAHTSRECSARVDISFQGAVDYGISGYDCSTTVTEQDKFANVSNITVSRYDALNASDFINGTGGQFLSSVKTENTYYTNTDWTELGRLHTARVTTTRKDDLNNDVTLVKESEFTYYTSTHLEGMLESEVINPNGGCDEYLKTSYGYDVVGNVVSKESIGKTTGCKGNAKRIEVTNYDADGRYVKTKENGLFRTLNVHRYNKFGQATETSNTDGVRQYLKYDDFGNAIGHYSATGAQQYKLRAACPFDVNNCAVAINSYKNTELLSQQFLDKQGREIGSKVLTVGGQWVHSEQHYDAWGRVVKLIPASLPSTETVFDVFDNPVKVTDNQTGLVTKLTKLDRTATSKVSGNIPGYEQTQTTTFNSFGEKVTETDNNGHTLTYTYNILGQVESVKSSADGDKVLIVNSYNLLTGLKSSQTDLDSGAWHYTYNAFGELIEQEDANGNIHVFEYDDIGRKKTHTVNTGNVATWVYDSTKKHRLSHEYTVDWLKSYIYDDFGRGVASVTDLDRTAIDCKSADNVSYEPSSKDVRISANLASVIDSHCVVQLTTFDEFGRVFQQFDDYRRLKQRNEYIEAQGIHFTYRAGQVAKKQEAREGVNGAIYYLFSQEDGAGRVTHYNKGRFAMSVDYSDNGFLSTLNVGGGYDYIQSHSYEFDGLGNLTSRAFNLDGGEIETTRFGYDKLNRITTVNGAVEYAYDDNGNLTAKSGWTQKYENTKPHAISKREKGQRVELFEYDSNGNQTYATLTNNGVTESQREVLYSSRNKAMLIVVNNALVQFYYDANNRRFRRDESDKTTYYVGALEIVTEFRSEALSNQTYIRRSIGNDAVKTYHENGQESVQWLFTDHQGSVVAVVNNSGKLLKRFSYDAFGKQTEILMPTNAVDKLDWAPETGLFWTVASNQRAYTGHEPVKFGDDTRIIHMNGRIYDADTGRFMQADPFVQAPSNLQNYNRYSYVLNNPLSYTDPSGYLFKKLGKFVKKNWRTIAAIGLAAVGGYYALEALKAAIAGAGTFAKAYVIAGTTGFASGVISTGTLQGGLTGAATSMTFLGIGQATIKAHGAIKILAHASAGGVISDLKGGKFGHGFISAGITKGAQVGNYIPDELISGTIVSAVIGGTVSEITGGKFANGASTAAFQFAMNHYVTSGALKAAQSLNEKIIPPRLKMTLNGEDVTYLELPNGKKMKVFSGTNGYKNDPDATDLENNGPLPKGDYYIVERASGGPIGRLNSWLRGKDRWFSLYRIDGTIDDYTVINGTTRSLFRMHPGGASAGCVTFYDSESFNFTREYLLNSPNSAIPGLDITYFGTLTVE